MVDRVDDGDIRDAVSAPLALFRILAARHHPYCNQHQHVSGRDHSAAMICPNMPIGSSRPQVLRRSGYLVLITVAPVVLLSPADAISQQKRSEQPALITAFLAALLIVLISGCGQETVEIPAAMSPRIVSTTPVQGAIGVPLNATISATFSEAMNPATINAASFTLAGPGGAAVTGTIAYVTAGSVATFTPTLNLPPNTTFTATITTGAQDQEDPANSLTANHLWTFTTAAAPDTTPLTVISTIPVNRATGVAINQVVSPTFSEPMNPDTVNASTFTVIGPGGDAIIGVVTYAVSGSVAKFTPSTLLAYNTTYTATVTTGATDLAGNALVSNYVWAFTTGAAPDTTPPTVVSTIPLNGALGVPINQAVSATFSEAMNPATINGTTLTVTGSGGVAVAGAITYTAATGSVATFTPTVSLAYNTTYTATATTGETDLAGNALTSNYVWTFTTAAAPDTTPPTVVSTIPANAATGVAINQSVSATFSEAMNCATITSPGTTFTVMGPGTTTIAGTVNCTGSIATFTPTALLATTTPCSQPRSRPQPQTWQVMPWLVLSLGVSEQFRPPPCQRSSPSCPPMGARVCPSTRRSAQPSVKR